MKRSELKRGTSQMKRSEWRPARKAIKPVSTKRRRVMIARRRAQDAACGPRPWTCAAIGRLPGPCFGPVNGHEIKSRARSGRDDNLTDVSGQLPLCDRHNGFCEDFPEIAHEAGLVVHSWEEVVGA